MAQVAACTFHILAIFLDCLNILPFASKIFETRLKYCFYVSLTNPVPIFTEKWYLHMYCISLVREKDCLFLFYAVKIGLGNFLHLNTFYNIEEEKFTFYSCLSGI